MLKVSRGTILEAQGEQQYEAGEDVLTIRPGDKSIVGYDGFIHPLKKCNVKLNMDSSIEVEGDSATGLANYIVGWLNLQLDLKENLRKTMLDVDDFINTIEDVLVLIGMQKEDVENEEEMK